MDGDPTPLEALDASGLTLAELHRRATNRRDPDAPHGLTLERLERIILRRTSPTLLEACVLATHLRVHVDVLWPEVLLAVLGTPDLAVRPTHVEVTIPA